MNTVATSKFLSFVLRHRPDAIGLTLDANGWADVAILLACSRKSGKNLTIETLTKVVAENDKKRFEFSDDQKRIRASQGHSLSIELAYAAKEPPQVLYHGTPEKFLGQIQAEGLLKMNRHHVHLSSDRATAQNVGGRRGKPVILTVRALEMHASGFEFYQSTNGVWLTDKVPSAFIDF